MSSPGPRLAAATVTGLAAPGARAVLVGTGSHGAGSTLPGLPSVEATLDDLERVLREVCGMAPEQVRRVDPEAGAAEVVTALEEAVEQATGVVLFCHVGHGLLGPGDELYLATHGCLAADRIAQAVPYRTVRDLLGAAPGGSVVVLDCCFSGRATAPDGGHARDPFVSARPAGSFLLSSASYFALSFAPEGERHTLFGGRLLELLEHGDPGGPPLLTLDRLHLCLDRALRDGPARPHRDSEGTMGALVVAPNRAYSTGSTSPAEPPADVPCPYPGMEPFQPEDHRWFFGRQEQTTQLLAAVRDTRTGHPVILMGASGTGKSSLLRAGLLAGLERAHEAGDRTAPGPALLLAAPGPRPLRALAEFWAQATGRPAAEVEASLADGDFPPPLPGRTACRLLVVDQFEEVFTRCRDTTERARFLRALCGAEEEVCGAEEEESESGEEHRPAKDPADHVRPRVVLAVRADHYGNCLAHPGLRDALNATAPLNLPPLGERALRAAIEGPAADAGLVLEDGLTDRILHDLNQPGGGGGEEPDEPGQPSGQAPALPFLAHALRETWLRRSGAVLTLAGYQATGGIWRSVTTSAEDLYQSLDEAGRGVLRDLLLRMIHLAPGTEPVPRRVAHADLPTGRDGADRERVTSVRDRLTAARLVSTDDDGVRIAHEALLRAWPRLRSWILDARAELITHQRLAEAASTWSEHAHDRDYLFTGSRLAAVRPWLETDPGKHGSGIALTDTERQFLHACVRADRRARRRRRLTTTSLICLALLLTVAGTVAVVERDRSRQRAAELASKRIATQADALRPENPAAALDMSLAAYRTAPTAEARASLLRSALTPVSMTLTGHKDTVNSVVYRKDGELLASSSRDGTVHLWHTGDPYRPAPGPVLRTGGDGATLAWHPDGRYLTAHTENALYIWDLRVPDRPRQVTRVPADTGGILQAALSPDGNTLAVPAAGGKVWLWDLRDPENPTATTARVAEETRDVLSVAFHPDSRILATTATDAALRLWNTTGPGAPRPLGTARNAALISATFSPDGRTVAGGYGTGGVHTFDVADPARPKQISSTLNGVYPTYIELAYRPDGKYLAAVSMSGRMHTYDISFPSDHRTPTTGTPVPRTSQARSVAFRPDGRGIVSGDLKGRILLWNPPPRALPGPLLDATRTPGDAFDAEGRHLATGGTDGTPARIWDVDDGPAPQPVATLPEPWTAPRFLPGRQVLISRDTDYTRMKLWSLQKRSLRPGHEFRPASGKLAIRRDGRMLALQERDGGALQLWDIRQPDHPRRLGRIPVEGKDDLPAFVGQDLFIVADADGTQLWDISDPRQPRRGSQVKGRADQLLSYEKRHLLITSADQDEDQDSALSTAPTTVWDLSENGSARKLRDDITAKPHDTTLITGDLLATLSGSGEPALWKLDAPWRGTALQGSLSGFDNITTHPETGLVAASREEGRSRSLALWRLPDSDASDDAGTTELLSYAPGLGEDTIGPSIREFGPRGDILVLNATLGPWRSFSDGLLLVDTDPGRLADTLCSVRPQPVPDELWQETLPDLPYEAPCT
ncbi:caspase, EACC1-associated type [Streptomyces acidicola]|uniref:Uncharacterized protein n=1 Tax=Streptomyces acidicola TaxID=2596892 RepID=A0A5N8WYQ3_9ACTN|nr:caspase family protein [Streptomyces acidicola]MPY51335.1 hypothetical protein [Streptomyces acidicola]